MDPERLTTTVILNFLALKWHYLIFWFFQNLWTWWWAKNQRWKMKTMIKYTCFPTSFPRIHNSFLEMYLTCKRVFFYSWLSVHWVNQIHIEPLWPTIHSINWLKFWSSIQISRGVFYSTENCKQRIKTKEKPAI